MQFDRQKTVLLNPACNTGNSLKRFLAKILTVLPDDFVGHTTPDGWTITKTDINWLVANRPDKSLNPQDVLVILKKGDELLNYQDAVAYFSQQDAQSHIIVEDGGDHRMTDFETKLEQVVQFFVWVAVD